MPVKNNPLTPFIKGDFFKSPLEKGDSGGCLVCYDTNFEIPEHRVRNYPLTTLTVIFFITPPALNITFALPVFFLAVIVKAALPFSPVVLLDGLILIRFFPAPLIFADTFTSATGQPPPSDTVTVTTLLASFKNSKSPVSVSTVVVTPLHPEGVGVTVGDGLNVGVGVTTGDDVGVGVMVEAERLPSSFETKTS